jgi:hypothetical protein
LNIANLRFVKLISASQLLTLADEISMLQLNHEHPYTVEMLKLIRRHKALAHYHLLCLHEQGRGGSATQHIRLTRLLQTSNSFIQRGRDRRISVSSMNTGNCLVCNNLELRTEREFLNVRQHRIAFDFTPEELLSTSLHCSYCLLVFEGIRQFQREIGDFVETVARIYARGPTADKIPPTLSLEIYFKGPRTKLEIEFHTRDDDSMSEQLCAKSQLCVVLTELYSSTSSNQTRKT